MSEEKGMHSMSALRRISQGVVSTVDPKDQRIVHVIPREKMPYMSGGAEVNPNVVEYQSKNSQGDDVQDKVVTNTTLPCTWMPYKSNRVTPPDVQPGERVVIWQVGDEDQYWWTEQGLDDHLRRLETIVWAISGTPATKENKAINDLDWYFIEWSSHKKHLMISNSKANGEVIQYVAKLDFGNGKVSIADDLDNSLVLDSLEALWSITNTNKCLFKIDKDNIEVIAVDTFKLTAGKHIQFTAETMQFDAKQSYIINTQDYTVNAGNSITENTDNMTISASTSWVVNTTKAGINAPGGITLNGPLTLTGGSATSDGDFTTTGVVSSQGVTLPGHTHPGVETGKGSTQKPSAG